MRVDLVDVLAGLEDAFYNALNSIPRGDGLTLRANVPEPSRQRYSSLGAKSIFRSLRKFYRELNQDRQQMWSDYGLGLGIPPYSAFVQYNAPRVAQGVEPSRTPPIYTGNKVKNWDMFGNPPLYWTLGSAGVFYGNGHVSVPENNYLSDSLIVKQDLTLLPNTDYEVAFEFHAYDYFGGDIKFGLGTSLHTFHTDDYNGEGERVSFTFTTPSGGGLLTLPVIFYARGDLSTCYINDVSVIEV